MEVGFYINGEFMGRGKELHLFVSVQGLETQVVIFFLLKWSGCILGVNTVEA